MAALRGRGVRIVAAAAIVAAGGAVALAPNAIAQAGTCVVQGSGPVPNTATEYQGYKGTLTATGGVAPYTFTLGSGGRVPEGLTLSKSGILSGVPLQTADRTPAGFVVQITDSSTPAACSAEFEAHMQILPNKNIPDSGSELAFVEELVAVGPECVISAIETLTEFVPPNPDCIGLI